MTSTQRLLLGILIGLGFSLVSTSVDAKKSAEAPNLSAPSNVFIRNSLDADPSSYLGRFVKAGITGSAVDEASTFQSQCSSFVKAKIVDGGDVMQDEFFNVSSSVSASLGLSKLLNFGIDTANDKVVRVKYTLKKKMMSEIPDYAGFEACCKRAPDQCSDRFIGEFLMGVGAVYFGASSSKNAEAGIKQGLPIPGLNADVFPEIEFGSATSWYRGTTFANPVYFAFKLYDNKDTGAAVASGCGDWVNAPPKSSQGLYFVGISPQSDSEATARTLALNNAREQVVRYLGEQITAGSLSVTQVTGGGTVQTALQSQEQVAHMASGVASFVKDESWCPTPVVTAAGNFYTVKVLAFLPNDQVTQAATAMLK